MSLTVAVIAGGGFQGQGILDAIHDIDGARAILVDSTRDSVGELHADRCVQCPPLREVAAFEAFLLDLVRRESVNWVVPATQRELTVLARLSDRLAQLGARTAVCPEPLLAVILDKAWLYAALADAGIAVQPTVALAPDAPFPLIGRPRQGWGGQGSRVLRSVEDLRGEPVQALVSTHLWTRYLDCFDELSADFAIDDAGRVSPITLRRRVRVSGGFAVVSESVEDVAATRQLDAVTAWLRDQQARGLFNVQLLRLPDGECLVSDLNPRHGTSSGHALAEGNRLLAFMMGLADADAPRRPARTVRSLAQHSLALFEPGSIKGVVFDLDDTLLDQQRWMLDRMTLAAPSLSDAVPASTLMRQAYFALQQGHHASLIDVICRQLSRPDLHTRLLAAYRDARPSRAHLFAEALDVLRLLRRHGVALALLTDNPPASQRNKLAAAGDLQGCFDAIVFARESGAEKPDRAGFDAVARQLGLPAGELLMVGDNPARDALGAVAAGYAGCLLLRRPGGRFHARTDLLRAHAPDVADKTWPAQDLRALPVMLRLPVAG